MNKFVTVLCLALIATASAKPAYNYPQPAKLQSSSSGFNQIKQNFAAQTVDVPASLSAAASAPSPIGLPAPSQFAQQFVSSASPYSYSAPVQQQQQPQQQYGAPIQQQPQQQYSSVQSQQQFAAPVQQQYLPPNAPVISQSLSQPIAQSLSQPIAQSLSQPIAQPQQTIVTKEIYIHSGPEEVEEIGNDADQPAGPIRKNYRIVFVKAPSQNIKFNLESLKRAQASHEEKTVIYVLSKKPDLANIQSQLSAVQTQQKSHKPEVHFIKYKTQEEANRAQQEIQAQYEALGGSTRITDEGVAPVTSVIGSAGNRGNFASGSTFQGGNNFAQQQSYQTSQSSVSSGSSSVNFGGVPSQTYLPAKKK